MPLELDHTDMHARLFVYLGLCDSSSHNVFPKWIEPIVGTKLVSLEAQIVTIATPQYPPSILIIYYY